MKEIGKRLAKLFRETGFIKDDAWESYTKTQKSDDGSKSLMGILSSDVSLKTFKDLFGYKIELPFGGGEQKGKPEPEEVENIIAQIVQLSSAEILYILQANKTDLKNLAKLLVAEKAASPEKAEPFINSPTIRFEAKDYQLFVDQGLISSQIISNIVRRASTGYSRENRLNLALEILAFNKFITQQDIVEAIENTAKTKTTIPDVLEVKKGITAEKILKSVNEGMFFPSYDIAGAAIENEVLFLFPESFIMHHQFIPFEKKGQILSLAIADPLELALIDTISLITGLYVFPYFTPSNALLDKINEAYKGNTAVPPIEPIAISPEVVVSTAPGKPADRKAEKKGSSKAAASRAAAAAKTAAPAPIKPPVAAISERQTRIEGIDALVDSKSTVQLVSAIIESAISTRATDIHLEPQEKNMRVRFRIDGNLQNVMNIPLELQLPVISRLKVLTNMDVTERRRPQDGQFTLSVKNNKFDFRVSSLPTYYGEKIVMRVLDETAVIKGLGELGLDEQQQKLLKELIEKPYGMILVTGPTGSGKTTTLYSAMNLLNDMKRNIVTIEDPIEYKLEGINQVQVDNNIELTFAGGLRSILRQDPDVIMIGEIRDTETAKIAIRAALTGHMVFSTLHTNTSAAAIPALAHMEVQRFMIASAILCVIAQRLVRKICPNCIKSFKPDKGLKRDLGVDQRSAKVMYRGAGCNSCFNTGYSGRSGLYEILKIDDEIKQMIIDEVSELDITSAAVSKQKMTPLAESGLNAIYNKITSPEEVMEQVFLI